MSTPTTAKATDLPANTATYLPTRQQTSTTAGDVYVADLGADGVFPFSD